MERGNDSKKQVHKTRSAKGSKTEKQKNREDSQSQKGLEYEENAATHFQSKGVVYETRYIRGSNRAQYVKTEKKGNLVKCQMYYKGILQSSWFESNGKIVGKEITYQNGKVAMVCDHDMSFEQDQRYIENKKSGAIMTIYDSQTNNLTYCGEFNANLMKHGKGTEYSPKTGAVRYVGVWDNGVLTRIIKDFTGDEMIEYADSRNNVDASRRIPVYVGGYIYDEDCDEYLRNGFGSILDSSGRAIHEGTWKNGEEVSGTDLYDGWYEDGAEAQYITSDVTVEDENDGMSVVSEADASSTKRELRSKQDLQNLRKIQELAIFPSFNESTLKLYCLNSLKIIEIGDSCLKNVKTFYLANMPSLASLKVGKNCSKIDIKATKNTLKWSTSKSFSILNCQSLKSIEIGEGSFIDFGGEFKISSCNKLETLVIGSNKLSCNFIAASFSIESRNKGER